MSSFPRLNANPYTPRYCKTRENPDIFLKILNIFLLSATVGKQRREAAISRVTGERPEYNRENIQRESEQESEEVFMRQGVTWLLSELWGTPGPVSDG